ncbi:hypothetical protein JCM10908_005386 [Rhodotorula pacifica]|uniref:uncharacterized protein n=1 Tax=Rhodotorula pacifica TaxID=1495444 RepID=UPI003174B935
MSTSTTASSSSPPPASATSSTAASSPEPAAQVKPEAADGADTEVLKRPLEDAEIDDSEVEGDPKRPKRAAIESPEAPRSPEALLKAKKEEDEDVLPAEPEEHWWARPEEMKGFNLFRLSDLDQLGDPFIVRDDAERLAGLERMLLRAGGGFKREDLGGPRVEKKSGFPKQSGQAILGIEGICGQPLDGVDNYWQKGRIAFWVRDIKRGGAESWFPFGIYRMYWNGPAEKGEFDALADGPEDIAGFAQQETVVNAHFQYTRKMTEYAKRVYKDLPVLDSHDSSVTIGVEEAPATETKREEVRAATRFALSKRSGLDIGYTIWVYDRPITDAEIDDAVAARNLRREEEAEERRTGIKKQKQPKKKKQPKAKKAAAAAKTSSRGKGKAASAARTSSTPPVERARRSVSTVNYFEQAGDSSDDDEATDDDEEDSDAYGNYSEED